MDSQQADTDETKLTPERLIALGVLRPADVDRICAEETHTRFLVEGLLPAEAIAIAGGDSTIGKSPLMLQLALCVAAGIPFFGMPTTQGRVLYFDLENSLDDCKAMRDALARFLRLHKIPDDFSLVTGPADLRCLIEAVEPRLVVIDSLRAFRPEVTEKNPVAAEWLNYIRGLARKYGCSFLIVHHLRKPQEGADRKLDEECRVVTWLLEMEGPRALVNQTDVRIAVAEGDSNIALKVKWSRRVRGDSPLFLLERVCDEDGEPAGYRHLRGANLLSPERRAALERLPTDFSFREAKAALDRSDDPTTKFLRGAIHAGVVKKLSRGHYRKVPVGNSGEENGGGTDRAGRVSA